SGSLARAGPAGGRATGSTDSPDSTDSADSPADPLGRKDRSLGAADEEGLLRSRQDASQARAEAAPHRGFRRELRGDAKLRDDFRERREHRHRAAGVEARITARRGSPPEDFRDEAALAGGAVVGGENGFARDEAGEACRERQVLGIPAAEEEVRGYAGPRKGLEEEREGRGADAPGHDRDPLPALESRQRESVAQRTQKLRGRPFGDLFEERGPRADPAKQDLDIAGTGSGVGDGVGAAKVGPRSPGQVEHDELPGQDRPRQGGRLECDGEKSGGENLAANQ